MLRWVNMIIDRRGTPTRSTPDVGDGEQIRPGYPNQPPKLAGDVKAEAQKQGEPSVNAGVVAGAVGTKTRRE